MRNGTTPTTYRMSAHRAHAMGACAFACAKRWLMLLPLLIVCPIILAQSAHADGTIETSEARSKEMNLTETAKGHSGEISTEANENSQEETVDGAQVDEVDSTSVEIDVDELAAMIEAEARKHLGKPYHYGSTGPKNFDCSGFTSYVYRQFDIKISRTSAAQGTDGRAITAIDGEEYYTLLQKGDLVLFNGRKISKNKIGHVGIFLEADTVNHCFTFIHAEHSGVIISRSNESYYKPRFLFARRILPDMIGKESEIDSTAEYPFDGVGRIHPTRIALDSTDMQIILFGNGRWAKVDKKGHVTPGECDERIILGKDGYWTMLKMPKVSVPKETVSEPKETVDTPNEEVAAENKATEDSMEKPRTNNPTATEKLQHKVVKGDTLYSIARHYETTISQICQWNGITENTPLQIGQELRVR